MTATREYGCCRHCGEYVYRDHYVRHGDGQVDSDESPVWLVAHCTCNATEHTPETCSDCGCDRCWDTWAGNQVDCGCTTH
jgi:hypothetical protein